MYYLIPVVDSDILLDGVSLKDILKKYFPELEERESQRVDIIYSTRYFMPTPKEKLKKHNEKTKSIYNKKNIPMYLIAYGNSELEAREIVSGKSLFAKYNAALGIRKVTKEYAIKYFNENDYFNKVSNYFKHLNNEKITSIEFEQDPFIYEFSGVAYLDCEIDGLEFNGKFTGSIKLVKKRH